MSGSCPISTAPIGRLLVHHVRAAGQVDRRLYERLVQRDQSVAVPGDARLVAERLGSAAPSAIAVSSDRVVGVDLRVALGSTRSDRSAPCFPIWPACGRRSRRRWRCWSCRPRRGPARRGSGVSFVARSIRAVRFTLAPFVSTSIGRSGTPPSPPACRPRPAAIRQPDVADQHAAVEQLLPDRVAGRRTAEQHEVRVAVGHGQAEAAQPGDASGPARPDRVDAWPAARGVRERGPAPRPGSPRTGGRAAGRAAALH